MELNSQQKIKVTSEISGKVFTTTVGYFLSKGARPISKAESISIHESKCADLMLKYKVTNLTKKVDSVEKFTQLMNDRGINIEYLD